MKQDLLAISEMLDGHVNIWVFRLQKIDFIGFWFPVSPDVVITILALYIST